MFKFLARCMLILLIGLMPRLANAESGYLNVQNAVDLAYDKAHRVLFISGGTELRRYDLVAGEFLTPLTLWGSTAGMDISPDGSILAIANLSPTGDGRNYIDLLALSSNETQRVYFRRIAGESGTISVAFDRRGDLLISSEYLGMGSVPLRKINWRSRQVSTLGMITTSAILSASADRGSIAIIESASSTGAWGVYHSGDTSYVSTGSTGWINTEVAVSRNGTQTAIVAAAGTRVYQGGTLLGTLGNPEGSKPLAVAYSPVADVAYVPYSMSNQIRVINTRTGASLGVITTPGTFQWLGQWAYLDGRIKVAADGSYLFCKLGSGVYFASL